MGYTYVQQQVDAILTGGTTAVLLVVGIVTVRLAIGRFVAWRIGDDEN